MWIRGGSEKFLDPSQQPTIYTTLGLIYVLKIPCLFVTLTTCAFPFCWRPASDRIMREKLPDRATASPAERGEGGVRWRGKISISTDTKLKDGTFGDDGGRLPGKYRRWKWSAVRWKNLHPPEYNACVLERNGPPCCRGKLFAQYFSLIDILFDREWRLLVSS